MRPSWFPDWSGERCLIVASGPSAAGAGLDGATGRCRAIAVNESWRLFPSADMLYAHDAAWWAAGRGDGFGGLKVSGEDVPGARRVTVERDSRGRPLDLIVVGEPWSVGAGGGSGFQALNLAVQFGCRDIALVGFDASLAAGRHWHGDHEGGLENPNEGLAEYWRIALDRAAPDLTAAGVTVTNCSVRSALTAYPKTTLADWLGTR